MASRTPAELQWASFSVLYEVKALEHHTALHYAEKQKQQPDGNVLNSSLESALIHARCLIFFLEWYPPKSPHPADVLLTDFSLTARPPATVTQATKDAINTRIGHLSYKRDEARSPKYDWPLAQISNDICHAVRTAMGSVPQRNLHQDWAAYLKAPRTKQQGGKVATGMHPAIAKHLHKP